MGFRPGETGSKNHNTKAVLPKRVTIMPKIKSLYFMAPSSNQRYRKRQPHLTVCFYEEENASSAPCRWVRWDAVDES